jgi:hypothetical protein
MTTVYESPVDRQDDIEKVVQCLGALVNLQFDFPNERLDDDHVPREVQDGLEKLQQAKCSLIVDGAAILWDYAKDKGLADDVAKVVEEDRLPSRWSVNGSFVGDLI